MKNERKIFRIFELFAQISRLLPSPVSMISQRDHRNRGGRFCANNSTSIRTRFRQKIDKNNDEIFGLCLLRITGHHKNIESPCPLFEAWIANIFGNLSWLVLCCIEVDSDVVALLSYAHLPITTTGVTKYDQAH